MKSKIPYVTIVLLIIIICQYVYYASSVSYKEKMNSNLTTELGEIQKEYQIDAIEQVDAMNRDIIQAKYDLEVMRAETKEVYDTITNPTDKITNPQNYYEMKDGIVILKEKSADSDTF